MEVLIVLVVVASLAAIALPSYIKSVDTALGKKAYDSLQMIFAAQLRYRMDYGAYTTNANLFDISFPGATVTTGTNAGINFNKYNIKIEAASAQTTNLDGYTLKITYASERKECIATDSRGVRVCRAIGGDQEGSSMTYLLP